MASCGGLLNLPRMNVHERLARNVSRLRKAAGLTQEEFADRSGIHPTYISAIENGHRNPTIDVVERLASALEVDPVTLLATPA